jgi:hypothetical protein
MPRPPVDYNDDPTADHYTVDGVFQGDPVRNTRTGQTGTVTFADRQHESHVNVDGTPADRRGYPHTEIWPNSEVERIGP